MKKEFYVNGREVSKERFTAAFKGNKLFVCSVRKEDGAIFPLSIHLDETTARSNLAWMKVGCLAEDTYQILDMATVDISKLCLQCYVKDVQDKMMIAFKKAQGIAI